MLNVEEAKKLYYQQWQDMPGKTEDWQNSIGEQTHPARRIIAEIVQQNGKSVLEVACGIGVDYPRYKQLGIKYFGVDITPKFIEEAKRHGVPCKIASALALPFENGSFDSVYCKDLLLHLPIGDYKIVLKEMTRVSRGPVIVADHIWEQRTRYLLCEQYTSKDAGELIFFNNVYNQKDVQDYMESLGYTMKIHLTGSASIGVNVVQQNIVTEFKKCP